MDKNEIRKALYKEKPTAWKVGEGRTGGIHDYDYVDYATETSLGSHFFHVPTHEMGGTKFKDIEPAQLLSRWLVNY